MTELEQKIKLLADDIYESKTRQKRIQNFDKYLKDWNIIRLTPSKRDEISDLFEKYNLEVIKPHFEKTKLDLQEINKNDNIIIRYNEMEISLDSISKKEIGNISRPDFTVITGNCSKKPYPFQEEAYKELNKFYDNNSNKKGLLILPTGAGKTFTSVSWLLRNVVNKKRKIIWLTHRHELLEQVANEVGKLCYSNILPNRENEKISVHLISGSPYDGVVRLDKNDDIVIASVQTLNRNLDQFYEKYLKYNDDLFLVIDEAHHATARTYRSLIDKIENSCQKFNILGLTATPYRTAEKEKSYLSKIFDAKPIYTKDLRDLIIQKILANPKFVPVETNLTFSKKDFTEEELQLLQSNFDLPENIKKKIIQRKDRDHLIVKHYIENREIYKNTLVFALDQHHAIQLHELFKTNGVKSNYVISGTQTELGISKDKEHNKLAINEFRESRLETLVNVNILTEGTDLPKTQTVFLTRPTKSKTLMTQMVGRALRGTKAGGTEDAYIVSFIDNWGDLVAWQSPSELFVDENDLLDTSKDYKKYKIQFISIELIQQFANLANKTANTEEFEQYPAIMRIPIGWYSFELEIKLENDDFDYKSCKILVFEQHKPAFDELTENIEQLYKRYDYDKNNKLDEKERKDLLNEIKHKYFDEIEFPEPKIQDEDLLNIIEYYDVNRLMPIYFRLEDRENYDITLLANQIINEDFRASEQKDFIDKQWKGENGKSIWSEFYNKFQYFYEDLMREIKKINFPEETYKIGIPKKEYKSESLENFPLNQWPQEEYRKMLEAVYEKWNRENPDNQIEKKDRWKYEIDHKIPLRPDNPKIEAGKTILSNLRPLLRYENRQKGNKTN